MSPIDESASFSVGGSLGSTASLCKQGPEGTTATFAISATGGSLPAGTTLILPAAPTPQPGVNCVLIWQSTNDDTVAVSVTETAATAGTELVSIRTIGIEGIVWWPVAGRTGSTSLTSSVLGAFLFKNIGVELPGGEGCTPGYWKQRHHFDSWVGYTPSTPFGSVFANAFPGKTLLQVLSQGGGHLNALGRHAVAALLNAASGGVDYVYTPAQVIAAFNAAYASGDYEMQKNIFATENELGCPLN
jgi:hypothetical protein